MSQLAAVVALRSDAWLATATAWAGNAPHPGTLAAALLHGRPCMPEAHAKVPAAALLVAGLPWPAVTGARRS